MGGDLGNDCFVCGEALQSHSDNPKKLLTCKSVAISRLKTASIQRKDKKYVKLKNLNSLLIHKHCYDAYIRDKSIATVRRRLLSSSSSENSRESSSTRSADGPRSRSASFTDSESTDSVITAHNFDFNENCCLCGGVADDAYIEKMKKAGLLYRRVKFITKVETKENLLRFAHENNDNDFMKSVEDRIKNINLAAVNARYHSDCMARFYTYIPNNTNVKGRPITDTTVDILDFISNYIVENSDQCQYSLAHLIEKYQHIHGSTEKPNIQNIKRRLKEFFGDEMHIYPAKNDYRIIFVDSVNDVLEKSFDNSINKEDEEERIVTLAGHILLKHIRSQCYNLDNYPAPSTFLDNLDTQTPRLLQKLLNIIICTHKKKSTENKVMWNHRVTMFSHAIVASARPRGFISPLLLGISTLMHKKHASRTLIDSLSHLGLSASYNETLKFEDSMSRHPDKLNLDGTYIQMVFDNADHNAHTIDGKNTFHATGGIMCVTPASSVYTNDLVERLSKRKLPVIGEFGFMPVQPFIKPNNLGLKNVIVEKMNSSKESFVADISIKDFLWCYNKSVNPENSAGWNGFMEKCAVEKPYEISKVIPIPFINAPISNYDTIYTVLLEASVRCKSQNQENIFVTFDLPPYQKATEVLACIKGTPLEENLRCVILRLGQLHISMSFMGSIGYIMDGSGLNEVFSQVYAENSVDKILSGHAYSRAVRGHILVQSALIEIIIKLIVLKTDEMNILTNILATVGTENFYEVTEKEEFKQIYNRFKTQMNILEEYGPTAELWVQYIRMVEILKLFIEAERTGDWELHLYCARLMLPYLHAAGHTAYAKYLHLYLQEMALQKNKMNVLEFQKFTDLGYFTIRRSNKYRSGIASDMTIEQMLMRPMKSSGGLTHGRGMSENVVSRWILSSLKLINVVDLMEKYCNVQYQTSEQHVDTSNARIARDASDLKKLFSFFESHDPFPKIDKIMSITTGIIGNASINCHKAFDKGFEAMDKMQGEFGVIKLGRKYKIIPLKAATSSVKVDGDIIPIESNLIYQRMIINIESEENRRKYLNFELAPVPLSLFKDGLMRKTKKSALYDHFDECKTIPIDEIIYVIDGGLLLHKVVWQNERTISGILQMYVNYVSRLKGVKIVVFDGYSDDVATSTKSYERSRRQNQKSCCDIRINRSTTLTVNQEKFLSNDKNKEQVIALICEELNKNKIETFVAKEDADTKIVNTAIAQKKANPTNNVIVMGEDVDLLVLLTHLADEDCPIFYLKPSRGNVSQKIFTSQSFKHHSLKSLILFIHAMSGCDTTSAFYNKGKKNIINILEKNKNLKQSARIFYNETCSSDEIIKHGCEIIRYLYSTHKDKENLKDLRYKRFKSVKIKSSLKLESLPPTESAAGQHCLRVYLQIQKWIGNDKIPTDWGWTMSSGVLKPNFSIEPLIPDDLLLQVSCKCKTGCKSKSCTCRKNGAQCTQLCGNCQDNCTNVTSVTINEDTFNLEANNPIDAFVENMPCSENSDSESEKEFDFEEDVDEDEIEESENEGIDDDSESVTYTRKRQHSRERVDDAAVKKRKY